MSRDRVTDILESMTIEEKAWQLVGSQVGIGLEGTDPKYVDREEARELASDRGIGTVSPFGIGSSPHTTPETVVEIANELQRSALENSRLGIPLCIPVDATHGHAYIEGATVFPHNLGLAATFDVDLAERIGEITATEIRATGATQTYAPVTDVARDPRWGRTYETYGESPTVVGAFAAASVRGLQAGGLADPTAVAATTKHFPAYGQTNRGEDAAFVDISSYTFRRVFLPPFERVLEAGAASVMPCYNALEGEPVHGSERYLTDLLRDELAFDGPVVSDWTGVAQLETHHGTAADREEAVAQSRTAGVDVASVGRAAHATALVDLVESGELSESVLDESVRRLLALKDQQGLFEDPYVDPEDCAATLGQESHRAVAREAAEKSVVLLENDGTLPLSGDESLLVTGHNADAIRNQYGGWSAVREVDDLPGTTVLEGLETGHEGPVDHEPLPMRDAAEEEIETVVEHASETDVTVVVGGENWYLHEFGPTEVSPGTETGEFPTRTELALPPTQRELLASLAETDTRTILVLIAGRPLTFDPETVEAAMMAFFPGMEGGRAIADLLAGTVAPTGRLPLSWPRSVAQLPCTFDYLEHPHPIGDDEHPDAYDPQYPFGHGLGYADVEYTDLAVSPATVTAPDELTVTVTLENTSDDPVEESVLVFGRDPVSSRVTPNRTLLGFDRATVPGGRTEIEIPVDLREAAVVRGDERLIEAGELEIMVAEQTESVSIEREMHTKGQ